MEIWPALSVREGDQAGRVSEESAHFDFKVNWDLRNSSNNTPGSRIVMLAKALWKRKKKFYTVDPLKYLPKTHHP